MAEKTKEKKRTPFNLQVKMDNFLPATEEDKKYIVEMHKPSTYMKDAMKRLFANKVAIVSAIIIICITLAAIFVPLFWPYSYSQQLGNLPQQPVDASYCNLYPFQYGTTEQAKIDNGEFVFPHIFGTDSAGRDYFIRVIYGTRISLAVGFIASIMVLIIGFILGSISGFFGGIIDMIIMRIVDIFYSIPDMLIIVLLAAVIKEPLGQLLSGTSLESIGSNIISMFIVFVLLY